jgi:predicted RNase H-like nuclease (RuvC/YqgF family)
MRKSNNSKQPTPGTINTSHRTAKILRETMQDQEKQIESLQSYIKDLRSEILDKMAVIEYLEKKLERAHSVRSH